MQFVRFDEDHKQYVVCDKVAAWLSNVSHPLRVVTASGMYRSGKSTLLNILCKDTIQTAGNPVFKTSDLTMAETRGLWISTIIDNTLFIDSEGLGGTTVDQQHDVNIFSLSILLSSVFIYNSQGAINSQQIDQLHVAAKISELISADDYEHFQAPALLWVMRDFCLDMEDQTSDEYLETVLNATDTDDTSTSHYLKNMFTHRSCIPLPRPSQTIEDIRNLHNLSTSFIDGIDKIRDFVRNSHFKKINGSQITGMMLVQITKSFLDVINKGKTPQLKNVWQMTRDMMQVTALQESSYHLQKKLQDEPMLDFFQNSMLYVVDDLLGTHLRKMSISPTTHEVVDILRTFMTIIGDYSESNNSKLQLLLDADICPEQILKLPLPDMISQWVISIINHYEQRQTQLISDSDLLLTRLSDREKNIESHSIEVAETQQKHSITVCKLEEEKEDIHTELTQLRSDTIDVDKRIYGLTKHNLDYEHIVNTLESRIKVLSEDNQFIRNNIYQALENTKTVQLELSQKNEELQTSHQKQSQTIEELELRITEQQENIASSEQDKATAVQNLRDSELQIHHKEIEHDTTILVLQTKLEHEMERSKKRKKTEYSTQITDAVSIKCDWLEQRHTQDTEIIARLEGEKTALERKMLLFEVSH